MILQALTDYYDRRRLDPDPARRLPALGLEDKEIPFVIELRPDGSVVQLVDTRQADGKYLRGQRFLVPQGEKKTSGVKANLLWDSAEYAIGLARERKSQAGESPAQAFARRIAELPEPARSDVGVKAVRAALERQDWTVLQANAAWSAVAETNPVLTFRLAGDVDLICQRPAVAATALALAVADDDDGPQGLCLVEGRRRPVARLHPAIKGVWGAQTSGANIVSFNARAFESYGKTERQGENAPVGERAVFAYTTALNHLLARGSRNRVQVGDASTVFWADRASRFDGEFTLADVFGESDDPDRNVRAVQALLEAAHSGLPPGNEGDARFFVLGLAPNASRIAIRFWLQAPLRELAPRIAQHFRDLAIVPQFDADARTPSLSRLLRALAVQDKAENVPPRLAGEWMRAIVEGLPYPRPLLNAAVMRCRAEQATKDARGNVSFLRAAILKAWLNRDHRRQHPDLPADHAHFKEELDVTQPDVPYRLGRLFAVLERIQQQAQGSLNAGIRDRYYGAASTTPVAVFTTLLRLKNAHMKKLSDAAEAHFERLIGEILGNVEAPALHDFPTQLTLTEQGRFALGYYQQRQSFFSSRRDATDNTTPKED
jgi:CRISPR-associated protein Csd1